MNDKTRKTLFSRESDEWATPRHLLDLAAKFMEGIDLDPCDSHDNPNPLATNHFYIDTVPNSLDRPWVGRIYMNPPFSNIELWADKLINELLGDCTEAVCILPVRSDTKWFQDKLAPYTKAYCFIKGRVGYIPPSGKAPAKAPFPSLVMYQGWRSVRSFQETWEKTGLVLQPPPRY